jgi:hypothetical protein
MPRTAGLEPATPQSFRCSDTERSLERRQIGGCKGQPKEIQHWLGAIGIWTQQQNSRMFARRIDTDVAESLVGSDEETAFILDGLPNRRIAPAPIPCSTTDFVSSKPASRNKLPAARGRSSSTLIRTRTAFS